MLHSDIQTQYSALNMGGENVIVWITQKIPSINFIRDFCKEILKSSTFPSRNFVRLPKQIVSISFFTNIMIFLF